MSKRDHQSMSIERLREILDAYGARETRWPEQERHAALSLTESSEQARQLRSEAAALDAALDRWEAPSPTEPQRKRAIGAAPAGRRTWLPRLDAWGEMLWPSGPVWRPVTALAAAAALGVAAGLWFPREDSSLATDWAELAFDDSADLGDAP